MNGEQQLQSNLIRLPNNDSDWPVCFRSLTPMWHPAVFITPRRNNGKIYGTSKEDVFKQLQDIDYASKNPANIDASIQWRKDKTGFDNMNKIFQQQIGTECIMCGKTMDCTDINNQLDYSCYSGCVHHRKCVVKLRECPKCNKRIIN